MVLKDIDDEENCFWYALYVDTKREHIVSRILSAQLKINVFCPRIAFYRKLKRGKVKFVEALFPSYIFVHCNIDCLFRRIKAVDGVKTVVRRGSSFPRIPKAAIAEIQKHLQTDIIDTTQTELFHPGDQVEIIEGPLLNIKAVIQAYDNSAKRVSILVNFMERSIALHLDQKSVMKQDLNHRSALVQHQQIAL